MKPLKEVQRLVKSLLSKIEVKCSSCQKIVKRDDFDTHTRCSCPIICPFGCSEVITRDKQDIHERVCQNKCIPCTAEDVGCTVVVSRMKLQEHETNCTFLASRPLLLRLLQLESTVQNLQATINRYEWIWKLGHHDFSDQDLKGLNLTGMDLRKANLSNTNLSNANLSNANLSNANLSNANLSNANLSNADLSNAKLNANLSNANLSNPNLSNANLTKVVLNNAILNNAKLPKCTRCNTFPIDSMDCYYHDGKGFVETGKGEKKFVEKPPKKWPPEVKPWEQKPPEGPKGYAPAYVSVDCCNQLRSSKGCKMGEHKFDWD